MISKLKSLLEQSRRIVFFGGAGVSTESGIPDFRSKDGLYRTQTKFGRSPEEMLSYSFFLENPEEFFAFRKENLVFQNALPNEAHKALVRLEDKGRLLAVVTQNTDGLHQVAGSKTVFELHGSRRRNYCVDCKATYPLEYTLKPEKCRTRTGEPSPIPRCDFCGGIVRPDVVLFEESLDEETLEGAASAISRADTLIVGGTSLVVYPAAGLLHYFLGSNLVLINRDATPYDDRAQIVIHDSVGKVLAAVVD
jgi:NAD-dependent deacetylase